MWANKLRGVSQRVGDQGVASQWVAREYITLFLVYNNGKLWVASLQACELEAHEPMNCEPAN